MSTSQNTMICKLKKPLIVLFTCLIKFSPCLAQYDFVDPEYEIPCGQPIHRDIAPFIKSLFCWQDWESTISDAIKEDMLNKISGDRRPAQYVYVDDVDTLNMIEISASRVHVIDYNLDGNEDFIYPVWVPWRKTYVTEFWIKKEDQWVFDFVIDGRIEEFGIDESGTWMIIYHKLCCGDYTHFVKTLRQSQHSIGPSFQMVKKYAFIGEFRKLEREIGQTIRFDKMDSIALSPTDTLFSFSGRIHHHSQISKDRRKFNPVLVLAMETSGIVLAQMIDPSGQKWSFVKLPSGIQPSRSAFEKDHRRSSLKEDQSMIEYMGWVKTK